MVKSLMATIEYPVDTLLRVTSLLRRKSFTVKDLEMRCLETEKAKLFISIDEMGRQSVSQAILHLQKLEDVYEIEEL